MRSCYVLHISPNVNFNYLGAASLPHIPHPRYIYTVQFRLVENSANRYKYINTNNSVDNIANIDIASRPVTV